MKYGNINAFIFLLMQAAMFLHFTDYLPVMNVLGNCSWKSAWIHVYIDQKIIGFKLIFVTT